MTKKTFDEICRSRKREKQMLNEIIIVRLVLTVCLILYHSFAPFSNSWTPLSEEFIAPYYWISKFSYSFFLGSFVFISGYLYAHADLIKGHQPLSKTLKKKGTRLIVPSIVFSGIYLLIFGFKDGESIYYAIYSLINGRGHMWFLPMLFWLFCGIEFLKVTKIRPWVIFILTLVFSVLVFLPLPFRINQAFEYLSFFYLGYIFRGKKNGIIESWKTMKAILILSLTIWLVIFIGTESLSIWLKHNSKTIGIVINLVVYYGSILYTIAGTIFVYILSLVLIYKFHIRISNSIVKLSGLSFGIYLYQQFILIYLYYYTDFVTTTGILTTPWLSFFITLILSAALSYLTVQTKIGKALIG